MSITKTSFKTKEVEVSGFNGYQIRSQISKDDKVKKSDKNTRVWVAGDTKNEYRILKDVHSKGQKSWPKGGVTVIELETGRERFYEKQKVRLHPNR